MAESDQNQSQPPVPGKLEKQILVQRFMRMGLNQLHVLGYSVAGEETVCQIPELDVCFDLGSCPRSMPFPNTFTSAFIPAASMRTVSTSRCLLQHRHS